VVILISLLPVALLASGFFSGSETAMFSLNAAHRQRMYEGGAGSRAALLLLEQPRMLLITLMLGNMTANIIYFAVSSQLLTWVTVGWLAKIGLALASLLVIVLLGEVLPKMTAASAPRRLSAIVAPILLVIHRTIAPLRVVVDAAIITPMSRLTVGSRTADRVTATELEQLLALSSASGVVDRDEQQTLSDVMQLSTTTVRRVMTPRTRMVTIQCKDTPDRVRSVVESHRLTRLPVSGDDLDDIRGVLPVKTWLEFQDRPLESLWTEPTFIPEVTTLERALEVFRTQGIVFAIVVDEYGGTAGVLALQDIVEEIIGELAAPAQAAAHPPRPMGPGRWIIDGNTSMPHLRRAIGRLADGDQATTLGGLVTARLGRLPEAGDTVEVDDLHLEVHHVKRGEITTLIVSLRDSETNP
jgi:putative hemolysin